MNKTLMLDKALNEINSNVIIMNEALKNINSAYDSVYDSYIRGELNTEELNSFIKNLPPVDFSESYYEKRYTND